MKKKLMCFTELFCVKCGVPHDLVYDEGSEEFPDILETYTYHEPEIENLTKDQKRAIRSGLMRLRKLHSGVCHVCLEAKCKKKEYAKIELHYQKTKLKNIKFEKKKLKKEENKLENQIRDIKSKMKEE